ncbi:carboxylating nicotinate-nucleotide diphosphorylase [uncultured Methanomethylovorans sp.]|uniref:carboxylating nicotinate-nucleotide diphosphorylase n=1 Tax=uncultured Methanomethylovorans sp. TaxID=183759 RepID=UPI002AA68F81|nr:carboxylating nicotinate-nucleotide diphosphorylase [uncultured Methanomethylovorans sp.]
MLNSELERFIREDLGPYDLSCTLVPEKEVEAVIFSKEECTIAGIDVAMSIFRYFGLQATTSHRDGDQIMAKETIFSLKGSSVSMLRAERLSLNFLGHLSGIATMTSKCVEIVKAFSDTRVACTRKTIPGMRSLEKIAVVAGGGDTHRFSLSDCIMLKDNHIKLMGFEAAIREAKKRASFTQKIEVEVESMEEALLVAGLEVDIIMLDNMSPGEVLRTVQTLKKAGLKEHVVIEVSGNINIGNLEEYAKTGVDVISMGSLIHAARWVDVSMEFSV